MEFKMVDGFLDVNVLHYGFNLAELERFHKDAVVLKEHCETLRRLAVVSKNYSDIIKCTKELFFIDQNIGLIKKELNNKINDISQIGLFAQRIYLN